MKGRILDRVVAAAREHRSTALATDIVTGRQLLLDGDGAEGDLALDDAALGTMREALRTDRNRTIETPGGARLCRGVQPAAALHHRRRRAYRAALVRMVALADYAVTVIDPRRRSPPTRAFPASRLTQEWPDEALERLQPNRPPRS